MYLLVSEAMAQHILITVKYSPWRIDAYLKYIISASEEMAKHYKIKTQVKRNSNCNGKC